MPNLGIACAGSETKGKEKHVPAHLECQLSAIFILAGGRGSNAMIPGIMLGSADHGVNVSDTLELCKQLLHIV